jgi:succinate dehydrogenase/fumarate reductase flavoprotein subunit
MTLLEFITYCQLSNLVLYKQQLTKHRYKTLIRRDEVEVAMLYEIIDGKGDIIKGTLNNGIVCHLSPSMDTIVEAFFPNELN